MRRGYVRASARVREKPQLDALTEFGLDRKAIYVQSAEEDVMDFLRSLREGDEACVTTLDRLAKTRMVLKDYIKEVHSRGAVLVETKTGRRSSDPQQLADMVIDAINTLARDGWAQKPEVGKRFGVLGGRPVKSERMPEEQAGAIWFDARISSVHDALAKMDGWTMRSAYRHFGSRGFGGGRPSVAPRKSLEDLTPPQTRIYFIQAGHRVKIGLTDKPEDRVRALMTGQPHDVRIIAMMDGGFAQEKALHKKFAKYHVRREWYKFSKEIKDYVAKLPKYEKPKRK